MTCSKSAANALGLSMQDNTNGTCAAVMEKIIIWFAKNKITKMMTCSMSIAKETTPMVYADGTGQIIM